ncbi:MAG: sigma-70 family RNA polymerase sigma factor [Clostridia bacterium]|nr:sigma-70 family RNA polymerase sigma factor [Clostridia bacterium]
MNAKEYLSQAMYIDQRIDSKLEQIMKLRESASKATATLSDMPRPDSPNVQSMEETIVKIVDLEREINRDIDALVDLKAEARKVISKLDNPEQQLILEMRYLCYKSWAEIAEDLSFSESNVYKIHGEALKRIVLPETAHLLTS